MTVPRVLVAPMRVNHAKGSETPSHRISQHFISFIYLSLYPSPLSIFISLSLFSSHPYKSLYDILLSLFSLTLHLPHSFTPSLTNVPSPLSRTLSSLALLTQFSPPFCLHLCPPSLPFLLLFLLIALHAVSLTV